MESRNVVLAVLIVAIALGVFYMVDPTFGGLVSTQMKTEGFYGDVTPGSGPSSATGLNPPTLPANGPQQAMMVNHAPAVAPAQQDASPMMPLDNEAPSPMPFAAAEKPVNCYPKNQLAPSELLPNDPNSKWAQVNPMGAGDISGKNFLNAGALIGVNTVGSSLRNASWDLRSEPPNPQVTVSPWLNSTIEPDVLRRPLEIG